MSETEPTAEDLAILCLERMESEGDSALEEICRQHPEHAQAIRGVVHQLEEVGLLEDTGLLLDTAGRDPDLVDQQIGEFKLLERIGGGGMGVVYLAEQPRLGRKVALKLIRPDALLLKNTQERFRREIEAISKLDHPAICTVFEAGEDKGLPYLAMRYIDGENLSVVIARQRSGSGSGHSGSSDSPQTLSRKLEVIEKVAHALHTAHQAGIAHRDIKPANIMLDREGEPVILDFGLAFIHDESSPHLTASGEQIGTPAYMSPEQITGRDVTTRADVYALGVVLYEYLTSHQAFEGKTRESLYHAILTEDVFYTRKRRRIVSRELRTVIAKAIDKDPQRRFATAQEFADELRRIRLHEPLRTMPPGIALRTLHWVQRNPTASGILATTAVGLLASLLFLFESQRSNQRFRALALLEAAGEVEQENPELAFKYAREALEVDASLRVMSRIQEIMFRLRPYQALCHDVGRIAKCQWSPDGRRILVHAERKALILYALETQEVQLLDVVPSQGLQPYAFSPRGDRLAVGDQEGVIRCFDLSGGRAVEVSVGLEPPEVQRPCVVNHLVYREDGYLLCTYRSGHSRLWGANGHTVTEFAQEIPDHRWRVGAFLSDGRIVASGRIWAADGRRVVHPRGSLVPPHAIGSSRWVQHVVPCRDSFLVLSTDGQGHSVIRRFALNGDLMRKRSFDLDNRYKLVHVETNLDGSRVLAVFQGGSMQILDEDLATVQSWSGSPRTTLCARFNPGGDRIAVGNWGGIVDLFDLDGRPVGSMSGHTAGVSWLDWSPDGESLLSCSVDGHARIWQSGSMPGVRMRSARGWPEVAVSKSGQRLVYCDEDGILDCLTARGVSRRRVVIRPGQSHVVALRDSEEFFVVGVDGQCFIWDPSSDARSRLPTLSAQIYRSPAQVGPRQWILLRHIPAEILYWDGSAKEWHAMHKTGGGRVSCLAASRQGVIAIGTRKGVVRFCDSDGKPMWEPRQFPSAILALEYSKDGRRLMVGTSINDAYLWNLDSGSQTTFPGHLNSVQDVAFSLDGQFVATASGDGWVRIWDPSKPRIPSRQFRAHQTGTRHIAFLGGSQIVTSGTDGAVRFWQMDLGNLRALVEQVPVAKLTRGEWQAYEQGLISR